jgi:hypothetical protein
MEFQSGSKLTTTSRLLSHLEANCPQLFSAGLARSSNRTGSMASCPAPWRAFLPRFALHNENGDSNRYTVTRLNFQGFRIRNRYTNRYTNRYG